MRSTQPLRSAVAAVGLAVLLTCSVHAAPILYLVSVDTSAVTGTSGFLDFQFNPGDTSSQLAVAQVTNFNSNGTLIAVSPDVAGDVFGTLPGPVTFVNDQPFNDYFHPFTYGTVFTFQLSLSGPALISPNGTAVAGSTFGVGLYNSSQFPILTNQGNGFAGQVDIRLDGVTMATAFPVATGRPSVVTFEVLAPEPGTLPLLGLAIVTLAALRRVLAR